MADEILIFRGEDAALLKHAIARILNRQKYGQSEISKILGLTQPMVSRYLASDTKIPSKIRQYAEQIAEKIGNNKRPKFYGCVMFSGREGNYYLAKQNEVIDDEKKRILENLNDAFALLKGTNISSIMPQVKMNLALSKQSPRSIEDIASFANGFIVADDRISSNNGVRFGKSHHLASLLLYLKTRFPETNSIMNIRYDKLIAKSGFKYGYLTKDFRLKGNKSVDILLHRGDFGLEPCAYVLGKNALDVARKIQRISGLMSLINQEE